MRTDKPKKALLVEKDSVESIITEAILQQLGFQVRRAKQGLEGVINASFEVPDLILMASDMNCADKPAIDALRAQIQTRHTKTIAIVETSSQESAENYRALGFDGHVHRPVELRSLADILDHLNQRHVSAEG